MTTPTHDPGEHAARWPAETVAGVADRVLAAPPSLPRSRLVCIDGPAGSGKTTLARDLADELLNESHAVRILHMDDVYAGWDGLEDGVRNLARWVIDPLRRGAPARYRRFDWAAGTYRDWCDVSPVDVLIVEGVGAASRALGDHAALRVWVEAPEAARTARWLARDGEGVRPHLARWQQAESAHFASDKTAARADVHLP